MKKQFVFIFLMGILSSLSAVALEYGCMLQPNQLNETGTRLVKKAHAQDRSLDDAIIVKSELTGKIKSFDNEKKNKMNGTIEGFFRPQDDEYYSILPVPMFGVLLSRDRHVLYICAHVDDDPKKTHFTVYLMLGYDMDPNNWANFFGDLFAPTQLTVKPATLSVLGLSEIRKKFLFLVDWLPLFEFGFETVSAIQRLISNVIGDITEMGIERITVTNEYVELAGGVNLDHPEKATLVKRYPLKK